MSEHLNYASPGASRGASGIPLIGGYLGIAGTFVGTAIFLAGCFGFGAAFSLALIPVILGSVGFLLAFVGGLIAPRIAGDDPQIVAALIINLAVIIGGLLELMISHGTPIFAH
jgi:hypothetical protein